MEWNIWSLRTTLLRRPVERCPRRPPGSAELLLPLRVVRLPGDVALNAARSAFSATAGAAVRFEGLGVRFGPGSAERGVLVALRAERGRLELGEGAGSLRDLGVELRRPRAGDASTRVVWGARV